MDPIYLSPSHYDRQDAGFSLGGKRIISLVPGKKQPSEVIKEPKNILALSGNLELSDELLLKGKLNLELGGRLSPWIKMQLDTAYTSKLLSNAFGNGKVTGITPGKSDVDLNSFSFQASSGAFTSEKAGYVFFELPAITSGSDSWHMTEMLSKRTEAFEIPFTVNESYDLFITLPEGMSLATPDATLSMNNEFGSIEILISAEGNQLHIVRKLNITKTYVAVEKYDTFRMMINAWNSKKYREVVLKKGN